MGPLPKPFLTLLCYDAAIWAALLTVIGITVGGDPAWLAAIGIGGVGLTSAAAWLVTRPHQAPVSEPAGEVTDATEPEPSEAPAGLTEAEPEQHADSYEVLEAVPLAVLVVDRRRDILWANDRTRQLLGEAVAGRSLMGVLRHPPLIDALDQVIGSQSQDPAAAPSNTMGPIEGVETPIGRGRLLIADLKRLDAERVLIALKDASAEHRLERLRSDFIANVSHELKTPIATLMGFIETLARTGQGRPRCARAFPRHHA